jgi:ferritin-like metal-binding protein YciE
MARTVEISEDLAERIDDHRREGETVEEFIEELVNIYEQEGRFSDRGL